MLYGLDYLGLARFSKEARDAFPSGFALGVFSKTFGDSMPLVKEIVATGKCKALRVQLLWSDTHSFSDRDIGELKKEAHRWEEFARHHKKVPVYLSPFCEHNLSAPDKYLKIVKDAAPHCEPVNTPWKGALSSRYINEVHGPKSSPPHGKYIFSYDGSDMLDSDVEAAKRKHGNAMIWFGWTANFNGLAEVDDKPRPPREARKNWPTAKLIRSLLHEMGHAKGPTRLPPHWLWKSHAEDTGDTRSNKPVLITPVKAGSAELLWQGQVVSTAPYYKPFLDGRHRYYFPEWGFEIARKAGNVPLDLRLGGKVYAQVNPAFRDGEYR